MILRRLARTATVLAVIAAVSYETPSFAGTLASRSTRPLTATGDNTQEHLSAACVDARARIGYDSYWVARDTLFNCSFEAGFYQCTDPSGNDCWTVSNGLWAAGSPASPPGAHTGSWAAGLMLSGNYPNGADTRLVSAAITLPHLTAGENLQLRFWQWYQLSSYDWGRVEIQTRRGATWSAWTTPRGADTMTYQGYGGVWSMPSYDISSYSDSMIRFGFRFVSARNSWGDPSEDRGWVIDDVLLLKGGNASSPGVVESFESGLRNWAATRGQWEVGIPTAPPSPRTGSMCAGTVLAGNYNNGVDTRLVSPAYRLPVLGSSEALWLRFWHWHRLSSYDQGTVEVSTLRGDRIWNPWRPVRSADPPYYGHSLVWTSPSIDLASYADSTVRIGFRFTAARNSWGDPSEDRGWYIDDVEIVQGPQWTSLDGPMNHETFACGLGDWAVDGGQWRVGQPSPDTGSHSDSLCAGTVLSGNYTNGVDSRLISPPLKLAHASPLRLWFWHWGQFGAYDGGYVQLKVKRGARWSPWKTIDGPISGPLSGWELRQVADDSLYAYADSTVRIGFYFYSRRNSWGDPSEAKGWYIDDVRMWGVTTDLDPGNVVPASPSVRLFQNTPNPFNPTTRIDFVLPATSQATLAVYDVGGRRVCTLATGEFAAGLQSWTWHGRDDRGNAVASGVYVYRLETPETSLSRRMILLR